MTETELTHEERQQKLAKYEAGVRARRLAGRRALAPLVLPEGITDTQRRVITKTVESIAEIYFHSERGQFKELSLDINEHGTVQVRAITGSIGDEGTMAELFCRYRLQLFIGRRGGVRTYDISQNGKLKPIYGYAALLHFLTRK